MGLFRIHTFFRILVFLLYSAPCSRSYRMNRESAIMASHGSNSIVNKPSMNNRSGAVTDAQKNASGTNQIRSAQQGEESGTVRTNEKHASLPMKEIDLEQPGRLPIWALLVLPLVVIMFVVVAFYAARRCRSQRKMQGTPEIAFDLNATGHAKEALHQEDPDGSGQDGESTEDVDSFDRRMTIGILQVIGPEDADIALWAPEATPEEEPMVEPDAAPDLVKRLAGAVMFSGALVAFVVLNVSDLICRQLASKDGHREYSIYSVLILANLGSIIIGNIVTYSQEGANGIKQAWDLKDMCKFAVSSVSFNCMSLLKFVAIDFGMQSDTIMLINRLSVIVLAIVMAAILNKRQTKMQWALLITTTLAIILFVRLKDQLKDAGSDTPSTQSFSFAETVALLAAVSSMLCDVLGAAAESAVYLWCEPKAMYIQKTQLDFPGMLCFIIWIFADPNERTQLLSKGFFHGWNMWVVIVSILFLAKMWCASYIIKVLGPVVKQVASIAGMVLTYFTVMILFPEKAENKFDLNVCICVIVVALCVTDYAIATRAASKKAARKKEAAAKAQS